MKYLMLLLITLAALSLNACGNNGNNNNTPGPTANIAAIPQACGTSIPTQYCTNYNSGTYSNYPYSGSYGTYGYGYYNNGYYVPYQSSGYGCPYGYQPFYTGSYYGSGYGTYGSGYGSYGNSGYTCVAVSYMSSFGYQPYYTGYGAAQACDAYSNNCPLGLRCVAFASRFGYCSTASY